uniref:NADH dehydrogenase subunit 5 n=1 Tax=Arrugada affinis TaxID=706857 RepID=UPI002E7671FF|nr:NADH dehydrogenase subunit 5 [Arrugada affinis]WRK21421.1 NADH dehydrogenase subunit 5 [Arrugada affinis]
MSSLVNLYYMSSFFLVIFSFLFLFMGFFLLINFNSFLFEWLLFSINSVDVSYIIYVDYISMMFSFVVFFISSMVIMYSSVYMGDYNYSSVRFLLLVLLFVLSMLLMVISPNLISILLGWDGLGLVSYCLVIYYSSISSYLSGMITCLSNRLGDIGLLISIGWLFSYGSWNFMFYLNYYNSYIFYLIIFSCFTKSAQIPFSSWLPAAMAAPTPVSSLVHSSTLVTAGVYLLIRFYNFLYFVNDFFLIISLLTMFMSSICASYEFDLKSIIALSTLSQLGLMMSCLFMGMMDLSFFHLLSHAMFKSLLFLCSGIIIHLMGGCQDIRCMGSICLSMPLPSCCFNLSNMALCGFPFLSGFYSKDLIVEFSFFMGLNYVVFFMFYMGLGLTSLYSIRLFYYSFLSGCNLFVFFGLGGDIYLMNYSVLILSMFSVVFGSLYMWLLNINIYFLILPLYLSILTLTMVVLGIFLGYELNHFNNLMPHCFYFINGSMWFMYGHSYGLFKLNYLLSLLLIRGVMWGEYYGGLGVSFYLIRLSNYFQLYSLNSLKIFFMFLITWLIFLV